MDVHPRSDPPPKRAVSAFDEVLVDDEDDAPVPLAATGSIPVAGAEAPRAAATSAALIAYGELARFVAAREPAWGWRRTLFVVSGIALRPSRAERALREAVHLLLGSVEQSTLDPEKEASP